ncbi:MAG: hypothetical protein WD049_10380 [Candidatus Paceibacterota bacterium]
MPLFLRKFLLGGVLVSLIGIGVFAPVAVDPTEGVSVQTVEADGLSNLELALQIIKASATVGGRVAGNIIAAEVAKAQEKAAIFLSNVVLWITSWFLWLAGVLLNGTVVLVVLNMKHFVEAIDVVSAGWTMFRDLANIGFIFVLLYIGIKFMFNSGDNQAKGLLRNLILVALLINFSLFFTQVVIDFSNFLAVELHQAISDEAAANPNVSGCDTTTNQADSCISNIFADTLMVIEVYSPGDANTQPTAGDHLAGAVSSVFTRLIVMIAGSAVMIIAAFVLLTAALLLILRFVALVFLMIVSPLALAAFILPQTAGQGQKWLGALIKHSFFAPAFFLMLLLVIKIVASPAFTTLRSEASGGFISGVAAGGGAMVILMLNFIVVIAFLVGSILLSSKLTGSIGGKVANSTFSRPLRGVGGLAGRSTIGRLGRKAEEKLNDSRLGNSRIGTTLRSFTTQKMAKAKYGGGKSAVDAAKEEGVRKGKIENINTQVENRGKQEFQQERANLARGHQNVARREERAAGADIARAHGDVNRSQSRYEGVRDQQRSEVDATKERRDRAGTLATELDQKIAQVDTEIGDLEEQSRTAMQERLEALQNEEQELEARVEESQRSGVLDASGNPAGPDPELVRRLEEKKAEREGQEQSLASGTVADTPELQQKRRERDEVQVRRDRAQTVQRARAAQVRDVKRSYAQQKAAARQDRTAAAQRKEQAEQQDAQARRIRKDAEQEERDAVKELQDLRKNLEDLKKNFGKSKGVEDALKTLQNEGVLQPPTPPAGGPSGGSGGSGTGSGGGTGGGP